VFATGLLPLSRVNILYNLAAIESNTLQYQTPHQIV